MHDNRSLLTVRCIKSQGTYNKEAAVMLRVAHTSVYCQKGGMSWQVPLTMCFLTQYVKCSWKAKSAVEKILKGHLAEK